MSKFFGAPQAAIAIRGVHLDLKGVPPTPKRLMELLKVFAAARYNAILVEWEDMFPWTVDERFRCETAYTPEEVKDFCHQAGELGLEIIPLVQCLGHMETPLSVPGYEHLREVPSLSDCLNPLAAGARELVEKMILDVLSLIPDVRHFHLGGDEAWKFGTHPDTQAFIAKHGKAALYLKHVEPLLALLNARGVRPILWSDMMHDWPAEALKELAAKADLCPWGYSGHPDQWTYHSASKYIARFKEHGVTLWGAAAYKGADGHNVDVPNLAARKVNAQAWAQVAGRYGMKGVFATAWSRYSTCRAQNEPIDACLDAMLMTGAYLHDGPDACPNMDEALVLLGELGECEGFLACKAAMEKLADGRRRAWTAVQKLREQISLEVADASRRQDGAAASRLADLRRDVEICRQGADMARKALSGRIDSIWIERYLGERIRPLEEELSCLVPRAEELEPEACRTGSTGR